MASSSYTDRLKKATDLATRATHLEASLSSLSPLTSPLPVLHKAFPLYISAAEHYSGLLSSGQVPEQEKARIKKKWRLVLERAEKVKKRIETLGGHVGKVGVSDEVEADNIVRRGAIINGLDLGVWTGGLVRYEGIITQPELAKEQEALDPEWADADDKEWDADIGQQRWLVRQGPGADCSVVAGVGACLEHNRKWGTSLAREVIFPLARSAGSVTPSKSENGRHVVKLLLNGAWRSVLIDSLLPRSRSAKMPLHATSHPEGSTDRDCIGPPWIPLIMKGYFKAHGGYSLRGSNPAPDIYTLTGWTPERIYLKGGIQREKEWRRIWDCWKKGEVIVTLGSGGKEHLGEGLVPYHAYAVLDMREDENGERLLEVYDPGITRQHAEELHLEDLVDGMESMSLQSKGMTHSGLFTRTWDSVCADFETLNLNWNPARLPTTIKRHWSWSKPANGEVVPAFSVRYRLNVRSDNLKPGDEVWILLSQHITNQDRPLDDIALYVHEEVQSSGSTRSAGLLEESTAARNPYSNAVHVLYRYQLRRSQTNLIVTPMRDRGVYRTDFTLHAFAPANAEMNFERISTTFPFSTSISGELTLRSAGGHVGLPTWIDNPQYKLVVSHAQVRSEKNPSRLMLQGDIALAWNVKILRTPGEFVFECDDELALADSGAYAYGMTMVDISALEAGMYTVSVSAFQPGQTGSFTLTMESGLPVSLMPIPAEGAGMYNRTMKGIWTDETTGGRPSDGTYDQNVHIEVTLPRECSLMVRGIVTSRPNVLIPINTTLFTRKSGGKVGDQIASSGPYFDAISGVSVPRTKVTPGVYVLVLSTWQKGMGVGEKWEIRIWTDGPLEVERVK